jgi:glycerol transport system ATP-binding protein
MNLMPCEIDAAGVARVGGQAVPTAVADVGTARGRKTEVGVRPEFIHFAPEGLPVRVEHVADVGRFRIVDARHGDQLIKVLVGEGEDVPREQGHLRFDTQFTQVYADGWIVE